MCARMCKLKLVLFETLFFIATPAATAGQYGLQKRSTCFQFECVPSVSSRARMFHEWMSQLGLTLNNPIAATVLYSLEMLRDCDA